MQSLFVEPINVWFQVYAEIQAHGSQRGLISEAEASRVGEIVQVNVSDSGKDVSGIVKHSPTYMLNGEKGER